MVSKGNYFVIFILLLMIFVMFMFAGVSSGILSDSSSNGRIGDRTDIGRGDIVTADILNMDSESLKEEAFSPEQKTRAAILSEDSEGTISRLLVEWCVYNKYPYRLYSSWIPEEELADFDLLLFGDYEFTAEDAGILYTYAEFGKTMIFTQLPSYAEISADQEFAAFFGIKGEVEESVTADGIKIFSDFMLNKEREYTEGDYFGEEDDTQIEVPYYSLASGYEVYAVGILNNQKELGIEDKDLPPLLWKTTTGESFIFSVNSDIFSGMTLLGILTGFMAQEGEVYLYPVVNAQTISVLNYPYFSNENDETMQTLYSRSAEAVGRDLLWSNIIQILKNYGNSYSFFASPQLDYVEEPGPLEDYLEFYLREINKLPGDMGLSLSQVSDAGLEDINAANEEFLRQALPEYTFTALYAADFDEEDIEKNPDYDHLKDISLVMSEYEKGDQLISFLENDALSVKFNLDGYRHETMDDLRMCSVENVLGMCNVKVDIGRVFYPEGSGDEWNKLSLKWSRGDTYFKDFAKLDMVSVYEMEKRVRRLLALDYIYERAGEDVNVRIKNFDEEAYFILRVYNNSVDFAENAVAEKISDTAYLIKAQEPDVRIRLKEEHVLKKPANNKTIPSNPK